MIVLNALLALLNSPLVWFFVLVAAVVSTGLVLLVLIGGSRKPDYEIADPRDFDSDDARRYHGDDSIGRG